MHKILLTMNARMSVKIWYNRFHEEISAVQEVEDVRWSGFQGARRDHTVYEKLEEPVSFYFLYTEQMCSFLHNRSDLDLFTFKNFAH